MDTKLMYILVIIATILCHTISSTDTVEHQENTDEKPDNESPIVKIRKYRKCHRKNIEQTTSKTIESSTETTDILPNTNLTDLVDIDEQHLHLARMTREEIEERCRTTTEYNTYMDCLQHFEAAKSRAKRFVMGSCDDGDLDDDDDEYEDCSPQFEDCENCDNTCRNCYSRQTCRSCNSCSLCTSRRCCTKYCRRSCHSTSCRIGCREDCVSRIETNKANPNISLLNQLEEAVNITTVIKLHNLINTTNLVDIPIKINSTNINNITIEESKIHTDQKDQQNNTEPSTEFRPVDSTNPQGYPCCHIVYPRECHTIKEYPYKRCFHRRRRFCGPQCVSEVIFYPTQTNELKPPVLPPMMPPVMPPMIPPVMPSMMMSMPTVPYNYYHQYPPTTPTGYSGSACTPGTQSGTDNLGVRCTRTLSNSNYFGYPYAPYTPVVYLYGGIYPFVYNYYPFYPYFNGMHYNETDSYGHTKVSTIPHEEIDQASEDDEN